MYSSGRGTVDGVGMAFPKCYAKEMDQKSRSRWRRKDNTIRDARNKVKSKLVWQPMGMKIVKNVDNGILMLDMVNPQGMEENDERSEYDRSVEFSLDGGVSASFVVNPETKRRLSVFAQLVGLEGFGALVTREMTGERSLDSLTEEGGEEKKEENSPLEAAQPQKLEVSKKSTVTIQSDETDLEPDDADEAKSATSDISDPESEEKTTQTSETVRLYRRATQVNASVRLDKLREWDMVSQALARREITDVKIKDMIKTIQIEIPFHRGKPQLRPKNKIGFEQFSAFSTQLGDFLDEVRKPPDLFVDVLTVSHDRLTLIVNVSRAGNCVVVVKKVGANPPTNKDMVNLEKGKPPRKIVSHAIVSTMQDDDIAVEVVNLKPNIDYDVYTYASHPNGEPIKNSKLSEPSGTGDDEILEHKLEVKTEPPPEPDIVVKWEEMDPDEQTTELLACIKDKTVKSFAKSRGITAALWFGVVDFKKSPEVEGRTGDASGDGRDEGEVRTGDPVVLARDWRALRGSIVWAWGVC